MAQARRLCPHADVVAPDHDAYRSASDRVFAVLDSFTPAIEAVSVDEAFLDIGGLGMLHRSPDAVAEAVRTAMRQRLGLPCSVGVATSKLIAKMASRDAKPDGVLVVEAGSEEGYLHAKPVRSLWGVGEATHARLEELGVESVGDLASFPRATLVGRLGEALGGTLFDMARGADERRVEGAAPTRSISVEQTYDTDLTSGARMGRELLAQSDRLATRVRRAGFVAGTLHLKVRYSDFTTITRSHTFDQPVSTTSEIHRAAMAMLRKTGAGSRPVRLLGIGVDSLVPSDDPRQLALGVRSWEDVDSAVDGVRRRFGRSAVHRARLVGDLDGDETRGSQ